MSITLNHSDFQCLQDQLVELKTKNYELAEKNRRGQADFEAAKAKICSLQLKLEEQEQDFQITTTTLRREIESAYNLNNEQSASTNVNNNDNESNNISIKEKQDGDENKVDDYKTKYKKLLHKAKELQQRYEKSVEVVQQMDNRIQALTIRVGKLEEENAKLKNELDEKQNEMTCLDEDNPINPDDAAIEHVEVNVNDSCQDKVKLDAITAERDTLKEEVDRLVEEVNKFNLKMESQAEEQKIRERKGIQMVKELKRQLTLEKNRSETLQKQLENLLTNAPSTTAVSITNSELDNYCRLSASSSTNGHSNSSNGRPNNHDTNSVGSWSLLASKIKSSNTALNETLSTCSIESEDRETVQQPKCDTDLENSLHPVSSSTNVSTCDIPDSPRINSRMKSNVSLSQASNETFVRQDSSSIYMSETNTHNNNSNSYNGMSIEEQAALMDRLTRLQHDKWSLEEKLSYLTQANSSMTEELANKSDIIKNYFMDQALRTINHQDSGPSVNSVSNLRKGSLSNNVNQLLSDKPSLKKVVDFLKDKSQVSLSDSETVSREATKKMQLMLEETLIKCIRLQENLDSITLQLNKLER